MDRSRRGTWTGLLAAAVLMALAPSGRAQERTMRFRPVPPESAARFEERDRDDARVRIVRRDTTDTTAESAPEAIPEVPPIPPPATPENQEKPEVPGARSTSGDIVRFGSDITVRAGQTIEGDVQTFGGNIEVYGHVTGDVFVIGGDLTLAPTARVDGDVVCFGGTLREEPGSSVGGKRVTSPRTRGARIFWPVLNVLGTGFKVLTDAVGMLFMLGIAWLFTKLAPARTQAAIDQIEREPGPSFVIGLLLWALIIPSVIALALVIAVLCITIIGIPLAAAVIVAYCAFFVLAALWGTVVGYGVLGHRLYPRFKTGPATLVQATIWGGVGLYALKIGGDLFHVVPVFGFVGGILTLIHFVLCVTLGTLGAGALVRGEYQRRSLQNWWSRMRPAGAAPNDVPPPPPPPTSSGAEVVS